MLYFPYTTAEMLLALVESALWFAAPHLALLALLWLLQRGPRPARLPAAL